MGLDGYRAPAVLAFAATALSGCATNLGMLQTARTLDPGHVRASVGAGIYVPAGQVIALAGTGVELAKKGTEALDRGEQFVFTEDEEEALLSCGLALATMPPSALFQADLRVGIVRNLDAGLRVATNAVRLDAKYRLLHSGDEGAEKPIGRSTDLALDVGVSKYLFTSPVVNMLGYVSLDHFDRWDFEGSLVLSHDLSKWFGLYGGLRYQYSRTTMDENLVKLSWVAGELTRTDVSVPAALDAHVAGGTVGMRAGHPYLSLLLEVTAGHTVALARVLGRSRDLGGLTLYPAIGLASQF